MISFRDLYYRVTVWVDIYREKIGLYIRILMLLLNMAGLYYIFSLFLTDSFVYWLHYMKSDIPGTLYAPIIIGIALSLNLLLQGKFILERILDKIGY